MSTKAKGSNAERELIKLFHNAGWAPIRVAGSGSSPIPCPDILTANGMRYLAVECKSSKNNQVYIDHEQIDQLHAFCSLFGAESWIAIKVNRKEWKFLKSHDLEKKGKSYCASITNEKGCLFHELVTK